MLRITAIGEEVVVGCVNRRASGWSTEEIHWIGDSAGWELAQCPIVSSALQPANYWREEEGEW